MELFFPEGNLIRSAPQDTKLVVLSAQPYPDARRLRVNLEVTPFLQRPYIELTLKDGDGEEVATVNIVEPMNWKLEFTMHLRGALRNPYTLHACLYYPNGPSDEPRQVSFEVDPAPPSATETAPEY